MMNAHDDQPYVHLKGQIVDLFKDPRAHDFTKVEIQEISADDERVALRGQSKMVRGEKFWRLLSLLSHYSQVAKIDLPKYTVLGAYAGKLQRAEIEFFKE